MKLTLPGECPGVWRTAKRKRLPFYAISAVTGQGVDELKYAMWEQVKKLRKKHAAAAEEPPVGMLAVAERRRRPRDWRK